MNNNKTHGQAYYRKVPPTCMYLRRGMRERRAYSG